MHVRNVAVVVISLSLGLTLGACGTGRGAATTQTKQVTDGVDGAISTLGSDMKVNSILLVAQPDGSAVLVGSIVNRAEREDALIGVAANGVVGTLSQTAIPLNQNQPLFFSGDQANANVIFPNINAGIGERVKVQFFFGVAGELTLDAIVRDKAGIYAAVGSQKA